MKFYLIACYILLAGIFQACDTCNNCGPVMDDPYFTIEFSLRKNRQTVVIKMDTVNNIAVNQMGSLFLRQGSSFRLPLSPSADVSSFDLTFTELSAEIPDTVQFRRQVQVSYQRQLIESNGTVKIRAEQFRIMHHDFDSISPVTFDPSKISNELKLQVFL